MHAMIIVMVCIVLYRSETVFTVCDRPCVVSVNYDGFDGL